MEGVKDSEEIHKPAESNNNHNHIWIQQTDVKETCQGSDDSQSVPKPSEETVAKDVDMPSQAKGICPSNTTTMQCEEYIETDSLGIDDCFQQNKACVSETKNPKQRELQVGRGTDILDINETCQRDDIVRSESSNLKQIKENQDRGQSFQVTENINEWITPVATQEDGSSIKHRYDNALLANDGDIGEGNDIEEQSIVTNEMITDKHNEDTVGDFKERTEQKRNVDAVVTFSQGENDVTSEDRGVGGRQNNKTAEKEKCSESEYVISSSTVQNPPIAITSDTHQQEGNIVKLATIPDLQTQKLVKDGNKQTPAHKRAHLEQLIGSRLLGYHPQVKRKNLSEQSGSIPHGNSLLYAQLTRPRVPPRSDQNKQMAVMPDGLKTPSYPEGAGWMIQDSSKGEGGNPARPTHEAALVLDSGGDPTMICAAIEGSIPMNAMSGSSVYPVVGDLSHINTVPAVSLHQPRNLPQSFLGISEGAADEIYGPLLHAMPALLHRNRSSTHLTNLTKVQSASSSITNGITLQGKVTDRGEKKLKYFRCHMCNEPFYKKYDLVNHLKVHETEGLLECKFCRETWQTKEELEAHEQKHVNDKIYSCLVCDKSFNCSSMLKRHKNTHIPKDPFPCKFCGRLFVRAHNLAVHEKIHAGDLPHQCKYCDKAFATESYLTIHEKAHTQQNFFKCSFCGKTFYLYGIYKRHEKIHAGKTPHPCELCYKVFDSGEALKLHLASHDHLRPYKCTQCDKAYNQEKNLKRHIKVHTDVKPYRCQYCEISFHFKSHCVSHEVTHTGKNPFQCELCDKGFKRQCTLTIHQRVHTGEKPYQCPTCQKTFRQRSTLKSHEISHSSEKPYSCTYCDKRFAYHINLKRHVRVHTNERPYPCRLCKKRFKLLPHLSKHMKVHGEDRPYVCGVCGKGFHQNNSLKKHEKRHTGEETGDT